MLHRDAAHGGERPRERDIEKTSKYSEGQRGTDGRTDRPTDRQIDTEAYKDLATLLPSHRSSPPALKHTNMPFGSSASVASQVTEFKLHTNYTGVVEVQAANTAASPGGADPADDSSPMSSPRPSTAGADDGLRQRRPSTGAGAGAGKTGGVSRQGRVASAPASRPAVLVLGLTSLAVRQLRRFFGPFLTWALALCRATRVVCRALLRSHACWALTGKCFPIPCPIRASPGWRAARNGHRGAAVDWHPQGFRPLTHARRFISLTGFWGRGAGRMPLTPQYTRQHPPCARG